MSKRPAIQYYVNDHFGNLKLRALTPAEKGAWWELQLMLHQCEEYGVMRKPLSAIAQDMKMPLRLFRALAEKGVLKGSDTDPQPYYYRPRHAGKLGEPVLLVEVNASKPLWFCSRMVRDEWVRHQRGKVSRFEEETQPELPLDLTNGGHWLGKESPPKPPLGAGMGDGPSFASSSSGDISKQGIEGYSDSTSLPPPGSAEWQTLLNAASARISTAGCPDVAGTRPELAQALLSGLTVTELTEAAALKRGKVLTYVIATAHGRKRDRDGNNGQTDSTGTAGPVALAETPKRDILAIPESPAVNARAYVRNLHALALMTDADLAKELTRIEGQFGPEQVKTTPASSPQHERTAN